MDRWWRVQKDWMGPKKRVEGRSHLNTRKKKKIKQTESEITCGKPKTGN